METNALGFLIIYIVMCCNMKGGGLFFLFFLNYPLYRVIQVCAFTFNINCISDAEAVHKNSSVSGRPAGWLKKVRPETFVFLLKMDNIFLGG